MPCSLAFGVLAASLVCAEPPPPPSAATGYDGAVARLAADRAALATGYRGAKDAKAREALVARARARLLDAIDRELVPAWFGTPWEFYGTSEQPGKGTIACGYFVSTVLRDAGLRVPRVLLAQQASEHIVQTLTPEPRIVRLRNLSQEEVVRQARARGDGLYVIGLDFHVGFLHIEGASARFCHSSYLGARVVVCEKAEDAPAMGSSYYVIGDALGDERVVDWLLQRAIPVRRR